MGFIRSTHTFRYSFIYLYLWCKFKLLYIYSNKNRILSQGKKTTLSSLAPRCRVLPEQLTGLQLVKKFPAFHGTRRFITALTSVRHLSLSWASPIQSIYPHPTSWRSVLILPTHLRLGLPSGFFPSGFPTKTLYTPLSSPIHATCPTYTYDIRLVCASSRFLLIRINYLKPIHPFLRRLKIL